MDPITTALDYCRFTEIEAGDARLSAPWGVRMPRNVWPMILYVVHGAPCNLSMQGLGTRNALRHNSACLVLRGHAHVVQDAALSPPEPPVELRSAASVHRFRSIVQNRQDIPSTTSTFYLGMAPAESGNPLLFDALPDALIVDFDEMPAWLVQAQTSIRDELLSQRPGFRSVVARQAELAVIGLVRDYIASHAEAMPRWASLPGGSRVAAALRAFHGDIARPWTLDLLADAAGTSRSRLIAAAQTELGEGLFSYMTRHRMHEAARLLQETSLPIGRISRQVGYRSEAAFSIAFKRNRGVQPREARSLQRA